MEIIKYDNALKGKNSDKCKTLEYSFKDKEIDLGIATINGRYPDKGYGVNLVSKELIYVIEGKGTLNFENKRIEFSKGDAILIEPNEKYYYGISFFFFIYCFICIFIIHIMFHINIHWYNYIIFHKKYQEF